MTVRRVSAARAFGWWIEGFRLLASRPLVLLAIAALAHLADWLFERAGIVGFLARPLLAPALLGGFLFAVHAQATGRGARVAHLFQGLQDRLAPLVWVGLALSLAGAAIVLVGVGLLGGLAGVELFGALSPDVDPAAGIRLAAFVVVGLVLSILVILVTAFAVPRVMFDGRGALAAMRDSLEAARANAFAVPPFVITLVVAMLLATAPSALPVVGEALTAAAMIAVSAVSTCAIYVAYRELFAAGTAGDLPRAP